MNLLIDTNILIHLAKDYSFKLLTNIAPKNTKLLVSVVTVAEIKSIALQNNWGEKKLQLLNTLVENIPVVEINEALIETYIQIDSYSQCRNPAFSVYPFGTPRNMGKNDLWIASTAALLGLTLVTTDNDFEHLHDVFFDLKKLSADELMLK